MRHLVIPAKAGIQCLRIIAEKLETGFHRCDDFLRDHHDLNIGNWQWTAGGITLNP
jgi:hypothetical protein